MARPSVTVAAIVERQGRYLLVEEETDDGIRINQPAGHLEADESIVAAAVRETLEETAHAFSPTSLVGIYRWQQAAGQLTYVRFAFCGELGLREPGRELDRGILRTLWLTPDQLRACRPAHRSPLVLRCVEDHLAGQRYPLDILVHYG